MAFFAISRILVYYNKICVFDKVSIFFQKLYLFTSRKCIERAHGIFSLELVYNGDQVIPIRIYITSIVNKLTHVF